MGTVDTDKQRFRFKGEYETLKECKTVENYVQKIKKEGVKYRDGLQSGHHIQHLPQDINWYLRHGDWISNTYGSQQQNKTKWKVVVPAFYPDGSRKDQVTATIIEDKPKKRRKRKTK